MSSIGGIQPVTFDAPLIASSFGRAGDVERCRDVVDGERAVGCAFDEPATSDDGPTAAGWRDVR